jgi:AraC-like DNA-binding protein
MNDRERKGRNKPPKGESHGMHKLTKEQVAYIRERHASSDITYSELARELNLHKGHIRRIVLNLNWRD